MPVKTSFVTEEEIKSIPLPQHGKSYTVISHEHVINETKLHLGNEGLEITKEIYKSTLDGQVVQGIYHLNTAADPEIGMMFAWSNSYNKLLRFKCAIGARVFVCSNGMISGDIANYNRKHIGSSAVAEVTNSIKGQIDNASKYYAQLVEDKEYLKTVTLSSKDSASVLGRLFADENLLTLTQVGQVKREMDKPSYTYNAAPNSAWTLYNHITLSLKDSHPLQYLSNHQKVHDFFIDEFGKLVSVNVNSIPKAPIKTFTEYLVNDQNVSHGINFM